MTYLITGATGDVGSRVTKMLIERGERPRIFIRDLKKAQARFGERAEIFVGDLADTESLRPALKGVDALFLVTTGPEIASLDECAAAIAKATGVRHLVKLSSMDVAQGLAIGAWHEQGEAAIQARDIPFTFVRPSGFMSNLLAWTHSIRSERIVRSSTGNGKRAFIHSNDIAAIATVALTTGAYEGQSLTITGPEALTFAEVTTRIGAVIGRALKFESIADEEARQRYAATGASVSETDAHVALWRAIREGRLAAVTNTVEQVLGRKPISFDQWLTENAEAFC
jgi:uncharacterized protein YbjT (DUF2867 family)